MPGSTAVPIARPRPVSPSEPYRLTFYRSTRGVFGRWIAKNRHTANTERTMYELDSPTLSLNKSKTLVFTVRLRRSG